MDHPNYTECPECSQGLKKECCTCESQEKDSVSKLCPTCGCFYNSSRDDYDFKDFVLDYIKHFDAIPLEYEDANGKVYTATEVWAWAERLGLKTKI